VEKKHEILEALLRNSKVFDRLFGPDPLPIEHFERRIQVNDLLISEMKAKSKWLREDSGFMRDVHLGIENTDFEL